MIYSYDKQLLEDFLSWVAKEHGGVLVDISRVDIEHRRMYKYLNHPKLIQEYIDFKGDEEE